MDYEMDMDINSVKEKTLDRVYINDRPLTETLLNRDEVQVNIAHYNSEPIVKALSDKGEFCVEQLDQIVTLTTSIDQLEDKSCVENLILTGLFNEEQDKDPIEQDIANCATATITKSVVIYRDKNDRLNLKKSFIHPHPLASDKEVNEIRERMREELVFAAQYLRGAYFVLKSIRNDQDFDLVYGRLITTYRKILKLKRSSFGNSGS